MSNVRVPRVRQSLIFIAVLTLHQGIALAAEPVLSPRGYGVIQFGQTLKSAEKVLNESIASPVLSIECDYVEFKKLPNVKFMVENGVITRADVSETISNSAGIRVGMSIARVKRIQPRIKIEPAHYDPNGHDMTLSTQDQRAALVFEADKYKVTSIRGGLQPSVGYVERCL